MKKKLDKRMTIAIIVAVLTGIAVIYFGGVFGQFFTNYAEWQRNDGLLGNVMMKRVDWNPIVCFKHAFTLNGLKSIVLIIVISAIIFGVYTLYDRFGSKERDPRGFKKSKSGTYGTASMMTDKEMKEVLELSTMETAEQPERCSIGIFFQEGISCLSISRFPRLSRSHRQGIVMLMLLQKKMSWI